MISANIRLSPSLQRKLEKSWMDNNVSKLVDSVANQSLWNIQEYGFGSAGGNKPSGGSPIWQGKIYEEGHYRGYLTESHFIKKINNNRAQIVSSAEFIDGVIEGYSTNWFDSQGNPRIFPPNYYHKRAVDKMFASQTIPVSWKNIIDGVGG